MLSISTNALRASPRGATARGSPAVAATRAVAPRTCVVLRKKSAAPTTAADASSFFTGAAVGVRSAFKVDRVVAARAPKRATGARADAAVAAAAATSAAPDPGRKFRVLASITGWYFLNAVFGASPAAPRERRDRRPRARVDTTDFVVVATRPFFPAPSRARATPSIHIFFFFNNPRVDP
tara:strand:+ start:606 stop:1145 length:540 start_codon:yes stop_codon:yes gene_type:complete